MQSILKRRHPPVRMREFTRAAAAAFDRIALHNRATAPPATGALLLAPRPRAARLRVAALAAERPQRRVAVASPPRTRASAAFLFSECTEIFGFRSARASMPFAGSTISRSSRRRIAVRFASASNKGGCWRPHVHNFEPSPRVWRLSASTTSSPHQARNTSANQERGSIGAPPSLVQVVERPPQPFIEHKAGLAEALAPVRATQAHLALPLRRARLDTAPAAAPARPPCMF